MGGGRDGDGFRMHVQSRFSGNCITDRDCVIHIGILDEMEQSQIGRRIRFVDRFSTHAHHQVVVLSDQGKGQLHMVGIILDSKTTIVFHVVLFPIVSVNALVLFLCRSQLVYVTPLKPHESSIEQGVTKGSQCHVI